MRIALAAAFVAATATLALADDPLAATDTAALHTSAQQGVPVQTPADNTMNEQSFYGFSDGCEKTPRKSDTAELLMN
jgi:hypothetical protein